MALTSSATAVSANSNWPWKDERGGGGRERALSSAAALQKEIVHQNPKGHVFPRKGGYVGLHTAPW